MGFEGAAHQSPVDYVVETVEKPSNSLFIDSRNSIIKDITYQQEKSMARYKPYNYDQHMMVPIRLSDQLVPGTIEFAIHHLVDHKIDMSVLDERYVNDDNGRPAYDPKVLLKVVLVAYARGISGSRKIEQACRENMVFIALTCGQVPDHTTIATFVSSMKEEAGSLFRDILLVCEEMGLLGGTTFALDGCKLPSDASKEWSGTHETLRKKQRKLEEKVSELMNRQIQEDQKGNVHHNSTQKQIERLEQKADRVRKFLEENDVRMGLRGKEVKSNVTDNESCFMKTSHGGIQGFNAQALVNEHQVIVDAQAFGNGQDYHHVEPMIEGARENLEAIGIEPQSLEGKVLVADSNYHSEANLKVCEDEKVDAYIPDVNFRRRDPRFETQKRHKSTPERFTLEDFTYDEARDVFICPQGRVLTLRAKRARSENRFFRRYVIEGENCEGCEFFSKCLEKKRGGKCRQLHVRIEKKPSLHLQMMEKIDTMAGRKIYEKRLGMVEPVFANIRTHKRLDRFNLRGKDKVNIQWKLYCMVHNIEKLVRAGYGVN